MDSSPRPDKVRPVFASPQRLVTRETFFLFKKKKEKRSQNRHCPFPRKIYLKSFSSPSPWARGKPAGGYGFVGAPAYLLRCLSVPLVLIVELGTKAGEREKKQKKLTVKTAKAPKAPRSAPDARQRRRRQHAPAPPAHVGHAVVAAQVQAVVEQVRGAVRQQRVALHLAEADAAAGLAALDGLARQGVDGADGADLELVGDLRGLKQRF